MRYLISIAYLSLAAYYLGLLELKFSVGIVVTAGIIGWLYRLWKRYRVRRPKPKPAEPGK